MTRTRTALVIDDEEPLRRLVARILERAGYTAYTAADGEAALVLFRAHRAEIDLVLLDVVLPTLRAEQLLPEFRAGRSDIAIILMSGDALPEALSAEHAAPRCWFLRKPFVPRTLRRLLDELEQPRDSERTGRPRSRLSPPPAPDGIG